MAPTSKTLKVVGAGPVGCVLAMLLAKRGHHVEVFEMRPDMRRADIAGGRSINLVLTNRGLRTLELFGLREKVLEITVPVLGRMMHSVDGKLTYQPYGKDESECNYSVSRGQLNEFLLDAAEEAGVTIHFEQTCSGVDFDARTLHLQHSETGESTEVDAPTLFGSDGAPSAVRGALVELGVTEESVEMLDFGYKEMVFPAADDGSYPMAGHALHIWPRGTHFLMGLANLDGSFTGTIYLPYSGPTGFDELDSPQKVRDFFEEYYPDAIPLLGPGYEEEFLDNPTGRLGTVRCEPWNLDDRALLVGDASHGIVPFFGQGLNSGLEDCFVLDGLLERSEDFGKVFPRFSSRRKPNTDAIADMALENFVEMRDKVGDEQFLLQKQIEHRIEQEFTDIYRSRYAMVMYSYIPYSVAYELGEVQKDILAELADGVDDADEVDLDHARELIEQKLVPLYDKHDVDLNF